MMSAPPATVMIERIRAQGIRLSVCCADENEQCDEQASSHRDLNSAFAPSP